MHSPNDYLSDAVSIVSLSCKMWPGTVPPFCWEKASVSMTLYIGRQKFVSILTSIGAGKKSQVRARSRHVRDL